jgi:lantibiotic modifying enzyme
MREESLAAADRIGARLCRDAIWSNGLCNWTADFAESENSVGHRALPPDLYDGTSGIALFLWHLAQSTGERIFSLTAEAALRQALSKLPLPNRGLYAGGAGVFYAELVMRGELNAAALVNQASPEPKQLDLISGSAGAIAVLLAAYGSLGCSCLLERALEHGDLLLQQGDRSDRGLSWRGNGSKNLTGFSHGAAGIGCALLELYCTCGEVRFREASLQAFAYERSHFDKARRNWPDFRERSSGFMNAWCHGAAGIALSRVRAWELLKDEMLLSEARVALETVCEQLTSMGNCSLCHGMLGNADILIYASNKLNRPDLLEAARQAGLQALDRFENRRLPWPCGLPNANELPDLLLGLAGIGSFYLRLADPTLPTALLPL